MLNAQNDRRKVQYTNLCNNTHLSCVKLYMQCDRPKISVRQGPLSKKKTLGNHGQLIFVSPISDLLVKNVDLVLL